MNEKWLYQQDQREIKDSIKYKIFDPEVFS